MKTIILLALLLTLNACAAQRADRVAREACRFLDTISNDAAWSECYAHVYSESRNANGVAAASVSSSMMGMSGILLTQPISQPTRPIICNRLGQSVICQ